MFKLKTGALALMGAASFCGGFATKDIADSRIRLLTLTMLRMIILKRHNYIKI
jgi:hypothetical protein